MQFIRKDQLPPEPPPHLRRALQMSAYALLACSTLVGSASATQAQRNPGEGQQLERRAQRLEQAKQRRHQREDPAYVQKNAWWNDEALRTEFALTIDQRQQADQALEKYMARSSELRQQATEAQQAFVSALRAASQEELAKHRIDMVEALTASIEAEAEFKSNVILLLSDQQRSQIGGSQPWILRSDWTGQRRPAALTPRARNRARPQ